MIYQLRTIVYVLTAMSIMIASLPSPALVIDEVLDDPMGWVCSVNEQQERKRRVNSLLGITESMGKSLRDQDKPYMEYVKAILTEDSPPISMDGDVITHIPSSSDLVCTVYYEYIRMSDANIIKSTTPGIEAVLRSQNTRDHTESLKEMSLKTNYMGSRSAYILAKRKNFGLADWHQNLDLIKNEDKADIKEKSHELSGLYEDIPTYGAQYASLYFRLLPESDKNRIEESKKQMEEYAEYHVLESEMHGDFTLAIFSTLAEPYISEENLTKESKKEAIRVRRIKAMRALAARDLIMNYRTPEIRAAMETKFDVLAGQLNRKTCPDRREAMLLELYRSLTSYGYAREYREVMNKYRECSQQNNHLAP